MLKLPKEGGFAMKLSDKIIQLRKANGWSQECNGTARRYKYSST